MNEYKWPGKVGEVVEVSAQQADDMLNVLPPIYGDLFGMFAPNEPTSHDPETGKAQFHWFAKMGGKHFCTKGTKSQARAAFLAML